VPKELASDKAALEGLFWQEVFDREAQFNAEVFERDRGRCICGKPIAQIHHILTRKKPRGWKSLPEPLKSAWPHIPVHGIGLCLGGHWWMGQALKHSQPLLLHYIRDRFGDIIWEGKTYREWLNEEPFRRWL